MGLKKKITLAMEAYVRDSVLPSSYVVAVRAGYDGSLEQFSNEVLEEMRSSAPMEDDD